MAKVVQKDDVEYEEKKHAPGPEEPPREDRDGPERRGGRRQRGDRREWRGDGRVREARYLLSKAVAGEVEDTRGAAMKAIELLDSYGYNPRKPARGRGRQKSIPKNVNARIKRWRFEEGLTYAAIADRLNAEGVETSRGGVKWWPSSIHASLKRTGASKPPRGRAIERTR